MKNIEIKNLAILQANMERLQNLIPSNTEASYLVTESLKLLEKQSAIAKAEAEVINN